MKASLTDDWFYIAAVLITGGKLPYGSFTAELYLPSSARHFMLPTLNEERYDHTVSEDGLICGGNGWVESVHQYLSNDTFVSNKHFEGSCDLLSKQCDRSSSGKPNPFEPLFKFVQLEPKILFLFGIELTEKNSSGSMLYNL